MKENKKEAIMLGLSSEKEGAKKLTLLGFNWISL